MEEQELLRSEARKFLDERCPVEEVRRISETDPGHSPELWKEIAGLGWTAVTAEMIGAAAAAIACTVSYAKERVQFGTPIGRYQGVKHPLAEMYVDVEPFKSILYYAAWCLDESPDEAPRYVSMAKAYTSDAFARIGIDAVQLYGAVGYTWEHDPHLYLKRSKWARAYFGDANYHYEHVAALGDL